MEKEKRRAQLSTEIRKMIIRAYDSGVPNVKIAEMMRCNRATVLRVITAYKEDGRVGAKPRGGNRPKKATPQIQEKIRELIDENNSITLQAIRERLRSEDGVVLSCPTINRTISDFNYSLKVLSPVPALRNDPETIAMRYEYAIQFLSLLPSMDGENFFFLDELGFNISMRARRGRSPVGQRAVTVVQALRSRNISVCCAINKHSTVYFEKQSTAFNRESFSRFMTVLMDKVEGTGVKPAVFIMDNVRFHKVEEVREGVERRGHILLFLPRYSPFLNPIENMFAQWKQHVRGLNSQDEQELLRNIDVVFGRITSENCMGYYRNMMDYIRRALNNESVWDG
jgi:transposase